MGNIEIFEKLISRKSSKTLCFIAIDRFPFFTSIRSWLVTDRVPEVGFSGIWKNHPKNDNFNNAFFDFLPNFGPIWWFFKYLHFPRCSTLTFWLEKLICVIIHSWKKAVTNQIIFSSVSVGNWSSSQCRLCLLIRKYWFFWKEM